MSASYEVGQQVFIKPVTQQGSSLRDSTALAYAGKTGVVSDYYWMTPPSGEVFYLYTVRVDNKEIVLYEDEISGIAGTPAVSPHPHKRSAIR